MASKGYSNVFLLFYFVCEDEIFSLVKSCYVLQFEINFTQELFFFVFFLLLGPLVKTEDDVKS